MFEKQQKNKKLDISGSKRGTKVVFALNYQEKSQEWHIKKWQHCLKSVPVFTGLEWAKLQPGKNDTGTEKIEYLGK